MSSEKRVATTRTPTPTTKGKIMNQNFDITDFDLDAVTVVSLQDSAALPEGGASYTSSSTCIVIGAEADAGITS